MISHSNKQSGATLLETIAVMAIMSSVLAGIAYWIETGLEDTKSQQAALFQKKFTDGVKKYLSDPTQLANVKASATTTVPVKVTMANLTAGNFIATGTGSVNSYNQSPCGLIYYDSASGKINALLTTEGGSAIPEGQLAYTSANAGDGAGFISATAPTVARGAYGAWTVPLAGFTDASAAKNCSGAPATGGRLATQVFFEGSGSMQSEFLNRDQVAGRPDLNTMNTPILFGAATVKTVSTACSPNGALARDTNGGLLTCKSGTWAGGGGGLNWKGTVASVAALPAGAQPGDTYRVSDKSNHAFTWDATNTVWQGLVVDSGGGFSIPGIMYAYGSNSSYGALTIYGQKNGYSGINFRDLSGNLQGTLMMNAGYSGFFNSADSAWRWYVDNAGNSIQSGNVQAGSVNTGGRITSGEYVQINGWAGEGGWCPSNGLVARDGTGRLLNCVSNYWRNAIGAPSGIRGVFYPYRGQSISCSDGYTTYYGSVDSSGYPTVHSGAGWVSGPGNYRSWGSGEYFSWVDVYLTTSGLVGKSDVTTWCGDGGCNSQSRACNAFWG